MRIAFAGFRHSHITKVYDHSLEHDDIEIVAASESDEPARAQLAQEGKINITHNDYTAMLAEVNCDVVAIGDYYGRRGEIAIAALKAGKHVLSDKPVCTHESELVEIAALVEKTGLRVGCQLDMRDNGNYRTMRRIIAEDRIGEVHTITFTGQHPLLYGTRPAWYFEEGKHGGTINDIAIHALDLIPWMTGRKLVEVVAARVWNARFPEVPHFQDGAQLMLKLDNGGGVLGDVSYFAPDQGGYKMPQYWRVTCHGPGGVVETILLEDRVMIGGASDEVQWIDADDSAATGYLDAFMRDIAGESTADDLTTGDVLESTRITLAVQKAAETGETSVAL